LALFSATVQQTQQQEKNISAGSPRVMHPKMSVDQSPLGWRRAEPSSGIGREEEAERRRQRGGGREEEAERRRQK